MVIDLRKTKKKLRVRRWVRRLSILLVFSVIGAATWYSWPYFKNPETDARQWLRATYDSMVESATNFWEKSQEKIRSLPSTRDRKHMYCYTATSCASWIKNQYQAEFDAGSAKFDAVRASGTIVTIVYRLEMVRADFHSGIVEDGRTLDEWADQELVADMRKDACGDLNHWDFINMGGTMIHDYRFADAEPFRRVVIDSCPGRNW